jgi:hypothetical protein
MVLCCMQADVWFHGCPVSMDWVNKYMVTTLTVLLKMHRAHTVLQLGEWN